MMQTDVKCGHLTQSGWIVSSPCRAKAVSLRGTASAGQIDLFDTSVAPTSATYAQSTTTVTVTSNGHGLSAGSYVGIAYAVGTGGSATCGNYQIATVTTNTFTITDPNSNTISSGANCYYVPYGSTVNGNTGNRWMMSLGLVASDTYQNYFLLPGEGVRASNEIYAEMTNLADATVFYG